MIQKKGGRVRIIGGQWRRRWITFPDQEGLRPTQDRIRETLFNWLMPFIQDASCLDLFAGSGALGFEALSRGARSVSFVEHQRDVLLSLRDNAERLGARSVEFLYGCCPSQVPPLSFAPYDIVFLDPPFGQNLLTPTCCWLERSGYLDVKRSPLVYIECDIRSGEPMLSENWVIRKRARTKKIGYYLYAYRPVMETINA